MPRLTLTAATLLIFIPWLISGVEWFQFPFRRGTSLHCFDLSVGRLWLVHYTIDPSIPAGRGLFQRESFNYDFIADVGPPGWRLLPTFQHDAPGTPLAFYNNRYIFHWHIGIPLYPFFLATGIPAALMWRTWFRQWWKARESHCCNCGYDVRGINGPCPECGAAPWRQKR